MWGTDKPTLLQPTPEMLTVEYLRPLVEPYLAAMKLRREWEAKQYTSTGRRKKGRELEKALALPEPPYPLPPLRQYGRIDGGSVPKKVLRLWQDATGKHYVELVPHSCHDEHGLPHVPAAEDDEDGL
jgi:hypothetical protein